MIVELPDSPEVVAVVPTLGGHPDRLQACLDSITTSEFDGRLALVAVWNDPRVPPLAGRQVSVLQPGMNLGFPASLNHARSRCSAEFIWVMQDDITANAATLGALHRRMRADDRLSVATPLVLNAHGMVAAGRRAGVFNDAGYSLGFPAADTRPEDLADPPPLEWVATGGALIRTEAWDAVGGYDAEFYPVQFADVDFTYRLHRAGWRLAIESHARIEHIGHGSTPSDFYSYLHASHQEQFRAKHFTGHPPAPTPMDVDPVIAYQVARAASLTLIDFARHVAAPQERRRPWWRR